MNERRERWQGLLLLVAAALLWSLGGLLIKSVDWPPLAVAGGRGVIAGVFLLVCVRRPKFTWTRLQLGAAVAYTACTVLFATATKLTTAANAILLQYTAPVWVALLAAWLLGERATRRDWATIAVALAGMALFFRDQLTATGMLGNGLAILSGVGFAVMTVLLRKQKDGSPIESIILGNLLAGLIGLPSMLGAPLPSAGGLGALLVLGVFQLGLSYLLYSYAIRRVTALEAVLVPVIEPVLNPVWVLLALGERPGPNALWGGAIVVAVVTVRALLLLRGPRPRVLPAVPT
jgi:drug/metabolite transporter (DMT)-like permease